MTYLARDAAAGPDDVVERVDPLSGLVGVGVRQLAGQAVADDRKALASRGHGLFLVFPRWQGRPGRLPPLVVFFRAAPRCPMRW